MSQFCLVTKTFKAGEVLAANRRVKLSAADTVSYADADEIAIGVTNRAAAAIGDNVGVDLLGARTHKVVASGAVTVNTVIFGTADGKVDDATGVNPIGITLEAALADGDVIEVVFNANVTAPILSGQTAVAAPTGGSTIDAESRTAINAIIARLVAAGILIAE